MSKRWLAVLAVMAALGWAAQSLKADDEGDRGKGNPHVSRLFAGDEHGRGHEGDRWEQRDGYEYHVYGEGDGRPPGWSKGKKTGWGNCGLPPGQAKKYGCRTYMYQGRPHYYYQDERGRIIVRRPIIHVEGGVDIH